MIGDLLALARQIVDLAPIEQSRFCAWVFDQAHQADKFRKRLGRAHRDWGDGTVMALALSQRHGNRSLDLGCAAGIAALVATLAAYQRWRLIQSQRGGRTVAQDASSEVISR